MGKSSVSVDSRRTVLLIGNYRPSRQVAEDLTEAGYSVIAGQRHRSSLQLSRFVPEIWHHPELSDDGTAFLEALNAFLLRRRDIAFVFPLSQDYVVRLLPLVDKIETAVVMPAPLASVALCLDKGRTYALAAEIGVPHAAFAVVEDWESLCARADSIGYPCVVKPNDLIEHGDKAYFVRSAGHLRELFPQWPHWHGSLIVQRFARGPRYNRYFIAEDGKILQYVDAKTLRSDRLDGAGLSVEGVSVAPFARLDVPCAKLVEHLNYTGVGNIQFLVDEASGDLSLLELIPRIAGHYAFARHCGLDQVGAQMALSSGQDSSPWQHSISYPAGKRYSWLRSDLLGVVTSFRSGVIGWRRAIGWLVLALWTAIRADFHLTWRWRDPLPTLNAYRLDATFLLRLLLRKISRRLGLT